MNDKYIKLSPQDKGIKDVEKIRPEFASGKKLVIVGGGYIGLETAAIAIKRGLEVTIIESAERSGVYLVVRVMMVALEER